MKAFDTVVIIRLIFWTLLVSLDYLRILTGRQKIEVDVDATW